MKKRQLKLVNFFAITFFTVFSIVTIVKAGTEVVINESMTFPQCLAYVFNVVNDIGAVPVVIVHTQILYMARIYTNDGSGISFLATCSKLDNKLIVNQTTE